MGLRGPKPSVANIACANEKCKHYNKTNAGNIVSNGTYPTKSGRLHKYLCRACGAVFCERKSTVFYDIRSDKGNLTTTPKRGGIKGDPKRVIFSPTV